MKGPLGPADVLHPMPAVGDLGGLRQRLGRCHGVWIADRRRGRDDRTYFRGLWLRVVGTSVEMIWIVLLGLSSGLMIGCIGIGGVILVPALVYLADVPIRVSIPAAMMAYIPAGLVGTAIFAHSKSIRWGKAAWLCIGATPTAFVGAWAVSVVNPGLLEVCLGLLVLFSGLNSLNARTATDQPERALSGMPLSLIGAGTGFSSSISGTGGPLVLVPILISMKVPVLVAVGLSQVIQLPVAVVATLGNFLYGQLDLGLGGVLALSLTSGPDVGQSLRTCAARNLTLDCIDRARNIGTSILGNAIWRLRS